MASLLLFLPGTDTRGRMSNERNSGTTPAGRAPAGLLGVVDRLVRGRADPAAAAGTAGAFLPASSHAVADDESGTAFTCSRAPGDRRRRAARQGPAGGGVVPELRRCSIRLACRFPGGKAKAMPWSRWPPILYTIRPVSAVRLGVRSARPASNAVTSRPSDSREAMMDGTIAFNRSSNGPRAVKVPRGTGADAIYERIVAGGLGASVAPAPKLVEERIAAIFASAAPCPWLTAGAGRHRHRCDPIAERASARAARGAARFRGAPLD